MSDKGALVRLRDLAQELIKEIERERDDLQWKLKQCERANEELGQENLKLRDQAGGMAEDVIRHEEEMKAQDHTIHELRDQLTKERGINTEIGRENAKLREFAWKVKEVFDEASPV
jgi:chromosome segregation ATPase